MDTALPQKFSVILDRNLAKANRTEDRVCTSCDKVALERIIIKTIRIERCKKEHTTSTGPDRSNKFRRK